MSERQFINDMNELFQLIEQNRIIEVIEMTERMKVQYSDRARKPILWKAAALAKLQQSDEAIDELKKGVERGEWWHPDSLLKMNELEPLHSHPVFQKIIHTGRQKVALETNNASPKLLIREGGNEGPSILNFHWRGSNAEDFSEYWLNEDQSTTYGFVQSSQVYERNAYCWDDHVLTEKDVHYAYNEFTKVQKGPLIVAGASQGGKIAINLILNNVVPAVGFITLAPAVKDFDDLKSALLSAKERGVRGCVIVGKEDFLYKGIQKLRIEIEDVDFPCLWIEVPNLGHFFPEDFSSYLKEAVQYIINSN